MGNKTKLEWLTPEDEKNLAKLFRDYAEKQKRKKL